MQISIIAALGMNREIGRGNTLLWHLPPDLGNFSRLTRDHPLIMGRKTFQSVIIDRRHGELLSGNRPHIVITNDSAFKHPGIHKAASLDEAVELAGLHGSEVFVIGGGKVYQDALPVANRLYLTLIRDKKKDADAFFPEYEHLFRKTKPSKLEDFKGLHYEFAEFEPA